MAQNTNLTVTLTPEIRLEQALIAAGVENPESVTKLTIAGTLTKDDWEYLCDKMNETLQELDISISDSDCTEIFNNADFRIIQLKSTKAWFFHWAKPTRLSDYVQSQDDFEDDEVLKMGKIYLFEDLRNGVRCLLSENQAGFLDINRECWLGCLRTKGIKVNTTPTIDYVLTKLKIHPEWKMYYEVYYKKQIYYIVRKNGYCALYNTDFEEIIDKKFGVDKIIPPKDITRQNELVIVKDHNKGIYDMDTDTIRWGYKGLVDDSRIDWVRR